MAQGEDTNERIDRIAQGIGDLLRETHLGARSLWALEAAINAAQLDGLCGILSIKIPSRLGKDAADVAFTLGEAEIIMRMSS